MSSAKRIDTKPQTEELEASTNKIVTEIKRQKTEQAGLLGTLLESQQARTTATKGSLQQQSKALGTALDNILTAFSGFSSEAESAASGANAAAERAAASRQEALRNPRTLGTASLLRKQSTSPTRDLTTGASRRTTNIFGSAA